MKYSRIENNKVVETISFDPTGLFHPSLIWVECPDEVGQHWVTNDNVNFYASEVVIHEPVVQVAPLVPLISPVTFKLLFTPQERLAIRAERPNDEIIDDLFTILDDPRLKDVDLNLESNKAVMDYLQSKGLITEERKAEILTGVLK